MSLVSIFVFLLHFEEKRTQYAYYFVISLMYYWRLVFFYLTKFMMTSTAFDYLASWEKASIKTIKHHHGTSHAYECGHKQRTKSSFAFAKYTLEKAEKKTY